MIKDQLEEEPEDPTDCVEALRHLRCLINFMDNELLPVIERIQSGKCQKVYFSDLWHLFKPGELMYAPLSSRVDNNVSILNNCRFPFQAAIQSRGLKVP